MKTASVSGPRWATRSQGASQDYVTGAQNTQKDQSANAIAAKAIYASQVQAAITRDAYAKGLQASGKAGWLAGITSKGASNYGTGVTSSAAVSKYTANSGKFDAARNAAASLARGPKGSAGNLARVAAVTNALHAAKVSA